jgi:hypothetical protein
LPVRKHDIDRAMGPSLARLYNLWYLQWFRFTEGCCTLVFLPWHRWPLSCILRRDYVYGSLLLFLSSFW